MKNKDQTLEFNQIEKILESYNKGFLKQTLLLANYSKSILPNLQNFPIFFNIIGLIFYRLKDYDKSIENFETAINLDQNYAEAFYNLGLLYFDKGNLENSYLNLSLALKKKKNYLKARNKIIELLTFYNPPNPGRDELQKINENIKRIQSNINFSKKINDQDILTFFNNCKSEVKKNLANLNYHRYQIFKRKSKFLNCERHKAIFSKYNTIPKFCFGCFKVVIKVKNNIDLIKLSLIFEYEDFFFNYNRKTLVDTRFNKTLYKGIIYCSSIEETYTASNISKKIMSKLIGNNFEIEDKRGCTEFSLSYPKFKKIDTNKNNLMQYPNKWANNEKEHDQDNTIENTKIENNNVVDSINGLSLNNILTINNWFSIKQN